MRKMTTITCCICGQPRDVPASLAHRYSTCGSPECVSARRHVVSGKSKGVGEKNPRYLHGRWTRTEKVCEICGQSFSGPAKRRFCSLACSSANKAKEQAGQVFTDERKARMQGHSGTGPKSEKWKAEASARFQGAANPMWKGGVTHPNKIGRTTYSYRLWRKAVFDRDGNVCRICGSSQHLVAHHLVAYADVHELRMSIANGMTLCGSCHKRHHLGQLALPVQT